VTSEPFGSRIKRLRLERGLSQEKLAELAKITSKYLSDIETGKRPVSHITVGIVEKLAKALNEHPRNLLYPDNC
jgi:transcriptional regulator with XRE-family HTH domain